MEKIAQVYASVTAALTPDQLTLLILLVVLLVLLVWGRWRYDLVAFATLVAGVILGVVPKDKIFEGFGHPATVIIALVLVVSYGLAASGVVELVARQVAKTGRGVSGHIATMAGLGATLSAIMNNVGALALLMPVDIEAARKAKRSPSLTLMPLAFATILGGLVTLIGTTPNIIVSSFREKALGEPFHMFDFAPVGLVVAVLGTAFVALIGWKILPAPERKVDDDSDAFRLDDYLVELTVTDKSSSVGKSILEAENVFQKSDMTLLGVVRDHDRLPFHAKSLPILPSDVLLVEAAATEIEKFATENGLEYMGQGRHREMIADADLELIEVVVRPGTRLEGSSSSALHFLDYFGFWLIGISRQGSQLHERIRHMTINGGDVLLLLGPKERTDALIEQMDLLPLAQRELTTASNLKAGLAATLFLAGIALASTGLLYLPVALAAVAVLYVLFNIVPIKRIYDTIEWPVVVLIGALIPIGIALEQTGTTSLLAKQMVDVSAGFPMWAVLALVMALTMALSDVMNNTATAVVAAPIAMEVASKLGAQPDPFLMAVAVGASCAFLTPIGHKNNTLVMGPGGYKFGDYWRLGLPVELLVLAVGVPLIVYFWPLTI